MYNRTFLRLFLIVFTTFCSCYVLSGCSSSTTTTTPPPNTVSPKKGSTYYYDMYRDSAGVKVAKSDTKDTATVLADGQQLLGQSKVYTVLDGADTTYFTYASNNDVMVYVQTTGLTGLFQPVGDNVYHRWITLGTSSKATGVVALHDTVVVTVPGVPLPIHADVVVMSDYIGDENITVGSETLVANHCRISATAISLDVIPGLKYTNQRDIYFVGKIGYAGKVTTNEVIPTVTALGVTGSNMGTFKVLTSYTLK